MVEALIGKVFAMDPTVTPADVWAALKATDEKLDRSIELGDRRYKEFLDAMERSRAEADRLRAATEAEFQRMARKVGDVSDRIGEFAESILIPGVRRVLAERGIQVHGVSRRAEREFDGKATEFDAVFVNVRYVVAVEVKSRLKSQDVADHLARMADFRGYFPEYRDRIALGAVAGMVIDDDAGRFAYREGLFVLDPGGGTIRIRNDDKFRPKEW